MIQKICKVVNIFFLFVVLGFAQEAIQFQVKYALEPGIHFTYRIEQQDSLLMKDKNTSSLLSWMQYTVRMSLKSKKPFMTFSLDSLWTLGENGFTPLQDEIEWKKRFQLPSFSSEVAETGQLLSKNAPFYLFWIPFPDTLLTLNQTWPFHLIFRTNTPSRITQEWKGTVQAFDLVGDSVAVFHFDIVQSEKGETIIPEPFRKIIITYKGKSQGTGVAYFHLKKRKIEKLVAEYRGEVELKKEGVPQKYSKISRILVKLL